MPSAEFPEREPAFTAPPSVSFVIPAYNSAAVIEDTLESVAKRLAEVPAEIIVVENGSTDATRDILRRVGSTWSGTAPALRVLHTEKGLGNALRAGIAASTGATVVMSADDLPFGFDDLDSAEKIGLGPGQVVIGSKAHPRSAVDRPFARMIFTGGFRLLRWMTLGMRTADPQGSFIMDGDWARRVVPALRQDGFLFSTELCYAAEQSGLRPVEVPVRLRESHHNTRIKVSDVVAMGLGLLAVRRRRRALRVAGR